METSFRTTVERSASRVWKLCTTVASDVLLLAALARAEGDGIAEAVELLRVEREHGDAALQQGVHLRTVRLLDGGCGLAFWAVPEDPVGHLG